MPVAQWLILVMGLSTITPDSSACTTDDRGDMYANGAGGLASSGGAGGFGSLGPNSSQAGGTGHGAVSGGGATDPGESGWRPESWPTGDHSVQVNSPTVTDSPSDTAGITHGLAGIRLPAGERPSASCVRLGVHIPYAKH